MCRRFQETTHYTLHATACLDQHLITISSPTVLHNHWLSLQLCGHPSPARRVSLSLSLTLSVYAWCLIPMTVNCTAVRGGRLLHAPAERGKTPAWNPVLGTQSGPQVAVVISRSGRLNASRWTLTHTRHKINPLCGAHSRWLGFASNYCITADFRPHY